MTVEHNIRTEWANVFECSCGFAYEGENRVEVERAHLYVNKFADNCNEAELREQIAKEIEGLLIGFVDGGTYNEGIIAAVNVVRGRQ